MAEGVFEGILGGEAEAPEPESEIESRVSADAFAAALAADHAKYDPAVARAAERFLKEQAHLLKLEAAELQEQRAIRLHHLHDQTRESQLRRFAQRMRNGLQIFVAILATAIGIGLVIMLADAFNARSVVVEPFDAPPALAARGLTGKVVAGGVLDALTKLQAATRSSAAVRRLSNAWTGDIKVEVPETGVSLSDLFRSLVARFGHETHIDGDLVQTTDGGLVLTIRGDGILPKSFAGAAGDLDQLTTQAAEYAYGQSQPSLYAGYLMSSGRSAEAVAFAKAAYPAASALDKPYVLNVWADAWQNVGGGPKDVLPLYREAIRLKPDFWVGYANIMNLDIVSGNEEDVWRLERQMARLAGGRPGRADEVDYQNFDLASWNLPAERRAVLADIAAHGGIGSGVLTEAPQVADVDQRMHDFADAELQLQTGMQVANDPSVGALTHFVHGRIAAQTGDTARAASEMDAFLTAFSNPSIATNFAGYQCWVAPAEEAAGHPDKADAVLNATGRFVDCYRFRGDILDHRGNWPAAQAAYAQAVAIAPDLPAAYYSWGEALARHGDLEGAIAKLSAAHDRGPGWADPLKAWGDVLARQGQWKPALAKYDAALKLAPAWAELHRAHDAAAARAA